MTALSLQVLSLLSLLFSTCQGSCVQQPTPVQIPIRNVTVQNQVLRRGVALSFGTPLQNFALLPDGYANNTFLFDNVQFCSSDIAPAECVAFKGGAFNVGSSSTWTQASGIEDAGGSQDPNHDNVANCIWGTDKMQLSQQLALDKFPLGISRSNEWDMNTLGLGRNSTVLNALLNAGSIASRSWGYFRGWTGAEAKFQMDGSLVLGGYDAAKISGNNYTDDFQIDIGCHSSLMVTVRDIIMNHPNGTNTSILGIRGVINACVAPASNVLTIPLTNWQLFAAAAPGHFVNRSYGINLWGMLYQAKDVYAGDLTYTLGSGVNIRIPNHQLVVPELSLTKAGQIVILNDTNREILINSLQDVNKNDIPLLGAPFLSSAYLLVNNDERKFTIWPSRPTQSQKLVALGPTCTATNTTSSSTSSPNSPNSPATSPTPAPSRKAPRSLIAGIVIGVSGAILFAISAVLLRRRRQLLAAEKKRMIEEPAPATNPEGAAEGVLGWKPELQSDKQPPQELPTVTYPHLMDSRQIFELSTRSPRASNPDLMAKENYI